MKHIGIEVPPKPGVYLIRHANTALNHPEQGERIRGWIDAPLDASGHAQSGQIANHVIRTIRPAHVLSSDLQRARHTAEQIAQGVGAANRPTELLRPWNLGQLQGRSAKDAVPIIRRAALPENADKEVVPGGEAFNQFVKRFTSALRILLDQFTRTRHTIVVVTHYRNLKLAQAWLKGGMQKIDLPTLHSDDTPTGSVMRIFPKGNGWTFEMSKVPGLEKLAEQASSAQQTRQQPETQGALRPANRSKVQDQRALQRAKKVDLITLPQNVQGTNCANCESIEPSGYCSHPEVMQQIPNPPKQCCGEWDAPGTIRAWEKQPASAP